MTKAGWVGPFLPVGCGGEVRGGGLRAVSGVGSSDRAMGLQLHFTCGFDFSLWLPFVCGRFGGPGGVANGSCGDCVLFGLGWPIAGCGGGVLWAASKFQTSARSSPSEVYPTGKLH